MKMSLNNTRMRFSEFLPRCNSNMLSMLMKACDIDAVTLFADSQTTASTDVDEDLSN